MSNPNEPEGIGADEIRKVFSGMGQGIIEGFIESAWRRVEAGQPQQFTERPGTSIEHQIQQAVDRGEVRSREDIARIRNEWNAGQRLTSPYTRDEALVQQRLRQVAESGGFGQRVRELSASGLPAVQVAQQIAREFPSAAGTDLSALVNVVRATRGAPAPAPAPPPPPRPQAPAAAAGGAPPPPPPPPPSTTDDRVDAALDAIGLGARPAPPPPPPAPGTDVAGLADALRGLGLGESVNEYLSQPQTWGQHARDTAATVFIERAAGAGAGAPPPPGGTTAGAAGEPPDEPLDSDAIARLFGIGAAARAGRVDLPALSDEERMERARRGMPPLDPAFLAAWLGKGAARPHAVPLPSVSPYDLAALDARIVRAMGVRPPVDLPEAAPGAPDLSGPDIGRLYGVDPDLAFKRSMGFAPDFLEGLRAEREERERRAAREFGEGRAPAGPPDPGKRERPEHFDPSMLFPPSRWERFREQATNERLLQAMAWSGPRGVMNVTGAAAGLAVPEVAVPVLLVRGLRHAIESLHDFAESTTEANKHLAQYSGKLAAAYAQLSLSDYQRNVSLAGKTGDTAEALTRATREMRDAWHAFDVASGNARNMAATGAAGASTGFARELAVIPEAFESLREALDPDGTALKGAAEFAGRALADAVIGPILPLLNAIKGHLGIKDIKPGAGAVGPWEAMIQHEAGPNRAQPIHGARPFNPAERRRGG